MTYAEVGSGSAALQPQPQQQGQQHQSQAHENVAASAAQPQPERPRLSSIAPLAGVVPASGNASSVGSSSQSRPDRVPVASDPFGVAAAQSPVSEVGTVAHCRAETKLAPPKKLGPAVCKRIAVASDLWRGHGSGVRQ